MESVNQYMPSREIVPQYSELRSLDHQTTYETHTN